MYGATFAKWYVAKLKAYPLLTNIGSAAVLMTTGDVLAQELEKTNKSTDKGSNSHQQEDHHHHHSSLSIHAAKPHSKIKSSSSMSLSPMNNVKEAVAEHDDHHHFTKQLQNGTAWDVSRTGMMVAWSVGAYTPFYVFLYRLYDKYLPKQTPASIAARVGLSFLSSIPTNAAFYVYGTSMHYVLDTYKSSFSSFNWHELMSKCQHKLESELYHTVKTSASCWIPVNMFTFTMVPPHLRPVSLMVFSVFWNCYLSLSQHKDQHNDEVSETVEMQNLQ